MPIRLPYRLEANGNIWGVDFMGTDLIWFAEQYRIASTTHSFKFECDEYEQIGVITFFYPF